MDRPPINPNETHTNGAANASRRRLLDRVQARLDATGRLSDPGAVGQMRRRLQADPSLRNVHLLDDHTVARLFAERGLEARPSWDGDAPGARAVAAAPGGASTASGGAPEAGDQAIPSWLDPRSWFSKKEPPKKEKKPLPPPLVTSGLGEDVDRIAEKSPTLVSNIKQMQKDGWTISYGEAGKGSFANKKEKKVVIDPNKKGNPAGITRTLAHESGHALYTADPYVPPKGLTKEQYVDRNAMRALKDEGEATLMNCKCRDEILANKGPDIGVSGAQAATYKKAYASYQKHGDREKAREQIGNIFANNERPSTDPSKTYKQNYSKVYEDWWDKNVAPKPLPAKPPATT